jgi:molecular chaperone DnaJ
LRRSADEEEQDGSDLVLTTERDYYDVLGIPRDADAETIKRAYRSLARELHPDVSPDPGSAERFALVAEAYRVLSKSTSRFLYDNFGYRGRGNGWFSDGAPRASRAREQQPRPVAEVEIDAFEAEHGITRRVRFTTRRRCETCGGNGCAPGTPSSPCPECDGSGRRRAGSALGDSRLLQIDRCDVCVGTGRLISVPCAACRGVGETSTEQVRDVEVPAGAVDGQRLPLDGGNEAVVLRVRPAPRDPRIVRYAAFVLLLIAIATLIVYAVH